ncbi:flagellar biosynthesis protein FlgF [Cellvibrio mixtus]|jgi:flagellar basal-body rod protein FlgF|uniref:Flagellar basal-body rod protein FlgF n=1 Tax=Cellvibrio mixtus TaxID=39650 RepID=A0A266Q7J1_9GAMM|nr:MULTISPECIES: flagellar basal body rod protein FlgF [Cellvibrio]AQT59849.1 flagellar biosynthesis protein FlgF [Cellvibrio sp. PSBB023]OZY85853.1 flagellar biosynthesis protein FlgF [Cellvibrio mixtus]
MDRLGYTAMTAASRTQLSLQVRANNLANASTTGFRADLEQAKAVSVDGYGYDSRHMALAQNNGVDLTPGPLITTGRDLDFAVKGQGLIALDNGGNEVYTRNGNMQVDAELRLTINGRPVMGEGGPIVLPEYDSVHIGSDGVVSVLPKGETLMAEVDRIKRVDVAAADLMKDASGMLVTKSGAPAEASEAVVLVSGHLESSNVSAIDQLVASMSLNRLFETQVKMMKAAEDLSNAGNRMIRGS